VNKDAFDIGELSLKLALILALDRVVRVRKDEIKFIDSR
jgi:hypothetical protein